MTHGHGPLTLDLPLGTVLPRFGKRVVPPGGRVELVEMREALTGYDTAGGALAGFGASLDRVAGTGGPWRLTLDGTTSVFTGSARAVPVEVRDLLLGVRAGAALRPVRRIERDIVVHRVHDAADVVVGEVADIHERLAETGPAATLTERRRLEISGWDGPFADAVAARLGKAGATVPPPPPVEAPATVATALRDFIAEQRTEILHGDLGLRHGEDVVHPTRVAIRQLRSALRVVAVGRPTATTEFDGELQWLSGLLGAVRDVEVLREHLRTDVAELVGGTDDGSDAALDAALAAVDAALDTDEAAARAALTAALRSRRYLALLGTLRSWSTEPPLTAEAERPRRDLSRHVRAANKDLERKLAKAGDSAERLHRARKAAKRARYVATFAGADAGKHGAAIAKRAKRLQTGLGDHQDCVVAARFVRRVAQTAPGRAAFGCGLLWVHEQERADRALRQAVRTAG